MKRRGILPKSKKGIEMSFTWLFAILAGTAILFIAIYAATQFIGVAKYQQYTEAAKSITILIDPLETGIASAIGDIIAFKQETRTHYNCLAPNSAEPFGKQTISFSEKSGLGREWGVPGGEISIRNKFIFANNMEQGKNLYMFSMPFNTGFKVTDLIFLSAEEYCFIAPPNKVEDEIEQINLKNINISTSIKDCPEQATTVCFTGGCDIVVDSEDYEVGAVIKDGKTVYFYGPLLYGAIFSDSKIYECNTQRLLAKTSELAEVYLDKIDLVSIKQCDSAIEPFLQAISSSAKASKSSITFVAMADLIEQMDKREGQATCKIYS